MTLQPCSQLAHTSKPVSTGQAEGKGSISECARGKLRPKQARGQRLSHLPVDTYEGSPKESPVGTGVGRNQAVTGLLAWGHLLHFSAQWHHAASFL